MRSGAFLSLLSILVLATAGGLSAAEIGFAAKPAAVADGKNVKITFELSSATDVTVEIIDQGGKILRHLAAGMLGPKSPPPFRAGLKQVLRWDRTDDAGKPVAGLCGVRVRLGLAAEFDRILGWGGPLYGKVKAMAVGADGKLRVLHVGTRKPDEAKQAYFSVFGREGEYFGSILPHDPNLAGDEGHNIKTLAPEGVGTIPAAVFRSSTKSNLDIYSGRYRYKGKLYPASYSLRQGAAASATLGLVMVWAGGAGRQLIAVATDGTVSAGPKLPEGAGGAACLAVLPDGKTVLVSAGGKVYRAAWGDAKARPFSGGSVLKRPGAVAVDARGNIYVADRNRVAVFKKDGSLLRLLAVESPGSLAVDPKGGAIYVVSKETELLKLSSGGKVLARLAVPKGALVSLDASARPAQLWIAPPGEAKGLWRVVDRGGKLVQEGGVRGDGMRTSRYYRIAAHPERDEIFLKRYLPREPKRHNILRMDGVTGEIEVIPVRADEICFGPEGNLYGTHNAGVGGAVMTVSKYDRHGKPVPLKGRNKEGGNSFTLPSQVRGGGEGGRGFTIAPSGDVYILHYGCFDFDQGRSRGPGPVYLSVFGPDGEKKKWHFIGGFTQGAAGIAVDRGGNVYVADAVKPVGRLYPKAYRNLKELPTSKVDVREDAPGMPGKPWIWNGGPNWYFLMTGTMLKFAPEGGALWWQRGYHTAEPPKFDGPAKYWRTRQPGSGNYAIQSAPVRIKGEKWAYFGISPVPQGSGGGFGFPAAPFVKSGTGPGTHTKHCVCHQARFAMDGHGRLFLPDALRFSVMVIDSAANELLRFGSFTPLRTRGPGSPLPQPAPPAISFAWAPYVAVNDHAVYVIDSNNRRIVKVRLAYKAEEVCPVP